MKTAFKIALGNIRTNIKRSCLTLLGVILSITLISLVCGLSSSIVTNARIYEPYTENAGYIEDLFIGFSVLACIMGCLMIYSAFSINFDGRRRMIGLLTSIGMSPSQKCFMILFEAMLYAVLGIVPGFCLGTFGAWICYKQIYEVFFGVMISVGAVFGTEKFILTPAWVLTGIALGLFATLLASFYPMLKSRKISVMDMINSKTKINISLRQSVVSSVTEKLFGRLGKLAGQNYENNKAKYRAISVSLAGGTVFFFAVYCFFMYPIRDNMKNGYEIPKNVTLLFDFSMIFSVAVIFIFLICASGSASMNINRRMREFAMLKSMGMSNFDICKMMCIETIYLVIYCAFFGLVGSLLVDYLLLNFWRIVGTEPFLMFYYPAWIFLLFTLLDVVVGILFALYSIVRLRNINVAECMRNSNT